MNNIQKEKVLIVDDSPENLMLVVNILKENYTVIAVTDGQKALDYIFQEDKPDIVLLDIIMEGLDGYDVCRKIKSDPDTKHIPIIFITALEEEADILKGFDLGAVDYVTKPFEPKILKARVKTHLELKYFNDELKKNLHEKEELLFKQSKMAALGEMFENIVHQWKQPLSIISMSSANLRADYELGEFKKEDLIPTLDTIEHSIKHLSQTIDDFRHFVHENVEKEYFELQDIINKTLELLSSKFNNREIGIHNSLIQTTIYSHKNELIQVLMNIFNNAIDALENQKQERWIKVENHQENETMVISVCDNAGGIPIDMIDKIFDKYVTSKSEKQGSGLGLFMSRQIMNKKIGGEIEVYNTPEGACFSLYIPLLTLNH